MSDYLLMYARVLEIKKQIHMGIGEKYRWFCFTSCFALHVMIDDIPHYYYWWRDVEKISSTSVFASDLIEKKWVAAEKQLRRNTLFVEAIDCCIQFVHIAHHIANIFFNPYVYILYVPCVCAIELCYRWTNWTIHNECVVLLSISRTLRSTRLDSFDGFAFVMREYRHVRDRCRYI